MKRRLRTDTLAPRIAASLIPLTAAFVAALLAGSPRTNAQLPQDRAATGMEEPDAKPAAPSNLAAVATSSTQVDLTWSDNSNNEESFKIGRSTDGVLFFSQETTDPNDTSYSDTTVAPATTYWYRIRAYNSQGYSSFSDVVSVTTPGLGGKPAAPSNLAAVATSSNQIDLTWNDNSNNEESFKIGRSTDGVLFFSQETTDPNDTSYSDTTVAASTTYWYRIRAYNSDGYSSYANVVSVTTPPSGGTTAKTPHGLYEIGGGFDNPGISGYRAELKWSTGNPSDGTYDWKRIDGLVDDAVSNHKQISLTLRVLSDYPAWVVAKGAKVYNAPKGPMLLPWDPIAQPAVIAFIKAVCLHFDGQLDYLVMGGMGRRTETYMPLPSEIGLDMTIDEAIAAWVASSTLMVDTYASNLSTTPFIIAAGTPFSEGDATEALTTVVDHGLLYPLFGIMQWGLKADSNTGFYINNWILNYDLGRATGFQITGASDGSVGGDIGGTLEECFIAADAMGADWVEIYGADADNPIYAALLQKYNSLLK